MNVSEYSNRVLKCNVDSPHEGHGFITIYKDKKMGINKIRASILAEKDQDIIKIRASLVEMLEIDDEDIMEMEIEDEDGD